MGILELDHLVQLLHIVGEGIETMSIQRYLASWWKRHLELMASGPQSTVICIITTLSLFMDDAQQ